MGCLVTDTTGSSSSIGRAACYWTRDAGWLLLSGYWRSAALDAEAAGGVGGFPLLVVVVVMMMGWMYASIAVQSLLTFSSR